MDNLGHWDRANITYKQDFNTYLNNAVTNSEGHFYASLRSSANWLISKGLFQPARVIYEDLNNSETLEQLAEYDRHSMSPPQPDIVVDHNDPNWRAKVAQSVTSKVLSSMEHSHKQEAQEPAVSLEYAASVVNRQTLGRLAYINYALRNEGDSVKYAKTLATRSTDISALATAVKVFARFNMNDDALATFESMANRVRILEASSDPASSFKEAYFDDSDDFDDYRDTDNFKFLLSRHIFYPVNSNEKVISVSENASEDLIQEAYDSANKAKKEMLISHFSRYVAHWMADSDEDALNAATHWLAIQPAHPSPISAATVLLISTKRFQTANHILSRLAIYTPLAYFQSAAVHAGLGDNATATDHLTRALDENPFLAVLIGDEQYDFSSVPDAEELMQSAKAKTEVQSLDVFPTSKRN